MRIVTPLLLIALLLLQYRLWIGNGSLTEVHHLENEIVKLEQANDMLRERNRSIAAEVLDLKQGEEAIEERARSEMGMVKKGEVFYQIVETASSQNL